MWAAKATLRDVGWKKQERAGHSELDAESAAVGGVDGELLAAAGEGGDFRAGEQITRGGLVQRARSVEGIADVGAAECGRGDGVAEDRREGEAGAFDFGEFGHGKEEQNGGREKRETVHCYGCCQSEL